MRLERLEINGFKSFSDRSELSFDKGVTAIVGPNGCGKSNVADAITWVMGEQSAKSLRGDRMEDVIFSGSDARKPTATAEVRLRLAGVLKGVSGPAFFVENADSHGGNGHQAAEVTTSEATTLGDRPLSVAAAEELIQSVARQVEVTRRLYRSGESEYLIDGQVCRLRDVHDLLMDTGLGAKAYAIIEQGKIGMILSSRPTDRRQLIEEAAGVTKYKSRRRAAELKLEAAQQNLLRIDDIVFEVDKQRGALKRQAAKARRYQKLRDELRRWDKVLIARKYRQLAATIESARARLSETREEESISAARVAQVEADLGRLRIELAEAESRATGAREAAHARELAINTQQQQLGFDREQITTLGVRATTIAAELEALESRREPVRAALSAKRDQAAQAIVDRDRAAEVLAGQALAYESAYRGLEGLEAAVEASRGDVFSAINSATALRHALDHASLTRDRVAETLNKLSVEIEDVRIESERVEGERSAAESRLHLARETAEATEVARATCEAELADARAEHEWRAKSVRTREQELAGLEARLKSIEELDLARAAYGDAPRAVLAQANGPGGNIQQRGAIADYLEVDPGYERAVEASLGDLLQYVVVDRPEHAVAGFAVVRDADAGRCGFLIASGTDAANPLNPVNLGNPTNLEGLVPLSSVVRVNAPFADAIRRAMGDAWIARSYERAHEVSHETVCPVVTTDGVVFSGPQLVTGGGPGSDRGILEMKREIKELGERIRVDREALSRLAEETASLESVMAQLSNAIALLEAEHHNQEKAIVGLEAERQHASDEAARLAQKGEQLARERRQAEEERDGLDLRQEEARASIVQLAGQQQDADGRLSAAQRRLTEARECAEDLSRRAAEARAGHATFVERSAALASEAERMQEAAADLETRTAALAAELEVDRRRIEGLRASIAAGETELDGSVRTLDSLRFDVQRVDDSMMALRARADGQEADLKAARVTLESLRLMVAELDVARATAEADLSHLATSCADTVQATLDEVVVEIDALEAAGGLTPDVRVIEAEEPEDDQEVGSQQSAVGSQELAEVAQRTLSAEEAITKLREKIDRLGPVNMMAIEQFDELETRHTFLTSQKKDLVESIAQTSEAIKRIDETTRQRFSEAFAAINRNFQETFSTLFGGGRAGLTLIDENDPLESGIEIIAQPPGKRLQSVQLLSGGEKALTAIALMFGMFKYKPSPFCLLDEIDAPLDDANIGRFVEMLRSMQQHTQFIVITHNRKTMEIADRLYGVTMEEPGVSKLISVQLN